MAITHWWSAQRPTVLAAWGAMSSSAGKSPLLSRRKAAIDSAHPPQAAEMLPAGASAKLAASRGRRRPRLKSLRSAPVNSSARSSGMPGCCCRRFKRLFLTVQVLIRNSFRRCPKPWVDASPGRRHRAVGLPSNRRFPKDGGDVYKAQGRRPWGLRWRNSPHPGGMPACLRSPSSRFPAIPPGSPCKLVSARLLARGILVASHLPTRSLSKLASDRLSTRTRRLRKCQRRGLARRPY